MVNDWFNETVQKQNSRLPIIQHLNNLIQENNAFLKDALPKITKVSLLVLLVSFTLLTSSCRPARNQDAAPSSTAPIYSPIPLGTEGSLAITPEILDTSTPVPSNAVMVLPTSTVKSLPTIPPYSSTPDLFHDLSISYLGTRSYGGGEIQVHEILGEEIGFTRYLFSYPSDGLAIFGFLNIPKQGVPPFPVVVALHGYIDPAIYRTLDYTTPYADILAEAGYMVFHPNLRGYAPSQDGPNLFRVGMAVDVMNLIALIKEQGGMAGPLDAARPYGFGLWGHSMGGGIALRVATLSSDIRAAVLYGAMSGDEKRNFEAIAGWSDYRRGLDELVVPEYELHRISPIYYLDRVSAKISIHHGEQDQLVPLDWSLELYHQLSDLGKDVECVTYPNQLHTFNAFGRELFMQRVIEVFRQELD
jgi:uncharacterized protein